MNTVCVNLKDRSYNIIIGEGLIDKIGDIVSEIKISFHGKIGGKAAVITNETVGCIYLNRVKDSLQKSGFQPVVIEVPDGEEHKTIDTFNHICRSLAGNGIDRKSLLIALGGGVVGDMAGFAAATYMRGVPYIQVPTSLLAMVDSSVGGKTGINIQEGKNLIGAFNQPLAVVIDPTVLKTLSADEIAAGMAEVVKYGVISDKELFIFLEKNIDKILNLDGEALSYIIKRSCQIKADVVRSDEFEENLRAILNFGHTTGHAIETLTGYKRYKHGEAVSIGMVYASLLSSDLGHSSFSDYHRIRALLEKTGLPVEFEGISPEDIIKVIYRDKKVVDRRIKFILMKGIGEVFIEDNISEDLLHRFFCHIA